MDSIVSIISLILNGVIGSGVLATWLFFRKQTRRLKDAEAFEKEVQALQTAMELLKNQVQFYDTRLTEIQKSVAEKEAYISTLSNDKNVLEIKNAKNKGAINAAYSCTFCTDKAECPTLRQRALNEEEYLRKVEQ